VRDGRIEDSNRIPVIYRELRLTGRVEEPGLGIGFAAPS
jgi:hypothetical protein